MKATKLCFFVLLAMMSLATGLRSVNGKGQAPDGTSPVDAIPVTVGACSTTTVIGSAAVTDPGFVVSDIDLVFYDGSGTGSPIHDWYVVELDKADNLRVDVTRANTFARLDVFLLEPIDRPSQHPEGVVAVDFSLAPTGPTGTISPRRVEAGKHYIGIRAETGSSAYTLAITRGTDTTQRLFIDRRISSVMVAISGALWLNRFTPTRYPATIDSITTFVMAPSGAPDPSGQVVTFVVLNDPGGKGIPPAGSPVVIARALVLPAQDYYSSSKPITTGTGLNLPITSGDFYAGLLAPQHQGIGILFDTDGLALNATFLSTDGGRTYNPVAIINPDNPSTNLPVANALIRAAVILPPCQP